MVRIVGLLLLYLTAGSKAFFLRPYSCQRSSPKFLAKGFGSSGGVGNKRKKSTKKGRQQRLVNSLADKDSKKKKSSNQPYVKANQDELLESMAAAASKTVLGRAVTESRAGGSEVDSFWDLMPSLITSRFPNLRDEDFRRVAGFLRHTLDKQLPLEDHIIKDPWRPHEDIHAYMPGLGSTKPFHDPSTLELCASLTENYGEICKEYNALLKEMENGEDRFQSVTSMNYESGWKTLVLFYNGHRIDGFPYHLCPTTTRIMESVPLAGRIAGFNRQQPQTGIPLHSDGNNMWLTCQMGVHVPDDDKAFIRVGPETRRWKAGECLVYDTTYEHETMNEHESQERVVLHVDFFNTLALTSAEIEVMQYIYSMREAFLKAEGCSDSLSL